MNKDSSFEKKREKANKSLKSMPIIRTDKEEMLRVKEQAKELKKKALRRKKSNKNDNDNQSRGEFYLVHS